MPKAVTIVGMLHGILFVAFMWMIYKMLEEKQWTFATCVKAFALSIIPFGTFFLNRLK